MLRGSSARPHGQGMQQTQEPLQGIFVDEATLITAMCAMKAAHNTTMMRKEAHCRVPFQLSLISCANKAEYLPVEPASFMPVMNVKLFVPVVCVPSTSANRPMELNGNRKKKAKEKGMQ